ncbi:hypothetical protein BJX64DRAFT_278560 [Aspergillus heterothallicus]
MTTASSSLIPFMKLSPRIFLSEPHTPDNKLIILSLFMNASLRISNRYVAQYRRLAPNARILLLTSSTNDFVLPWNPKRQHIEFAPAVEVLRAFIRDPGSKDHGPSSDSQSQASGISSLGKSSGSDVGVHIHLFSNGGVYSTTSLLSAYQTATGYPLHISTLIIDSAPGTAGFVGGIRSFSVFLPQNILLKSLGQAVLLAVMGFLWGLKALGLTDAVTAGRQALNEKRIVGGAAKRVYIYSGQDRMVDWRDVEAHAEEAEGRGWEVQKEKFLGSGHVDHMRRDEERYWEIVKAHL